MTVLVVEDNRDSMRVILDALKFNEPLLVNELMERGVSISPVDRENIRDATSLEEARERIDKEKRAFGLAILDLLIPETGKSKVDFTNPDFHGYKVLEALRAKFGADTPVILYSDFVRSEQSRSIQQEGLKRFFEILSDRAIAPPNEVLWKSEYNDASALMRKLVKYVIDLSKDDEEKLKRAKILVPYGGPIRRVLRELKKMAYSSHYGFPRADVLLLGENGVGKTTFAKAYHLLRPRRDDVPQLSFQPLDLGSLDYAGSAPNIALFGATDFNGAWSLGAFARSTLYKRGQSFLCFPGQEIEHQSTTKALKEMQELGKESYPETSDQVDFDGSGTLFLDEVVNISLEIQAMLLQAISYDLHSRHVYTTGHAPRRLRVGPTLVFATAQNWLTSPQEFPDKNNALDRDRPFRSMKDYIFRIDQMRVTIPPLRERGSEEIVSLLKALVDKRRPEGMQEISIDPLVLHFLEGRLRFENNVADLQRIADQVMPEESTITWQHIVPLYSREYPLSKQIRSALEPLNDEKESGGEDLNRESSMREYIRATQDFERYKTEVDGGKSKYSLSQLPQRLEISRRQAYNVGLIFLDLCGCTLSQHWPKEDQTLQVFNHGTKMLQTYLHRLSNFHNRSFGLSQALEDLSKLKSDASNRKKKSEKENP